MLYTSGSTGKPKGIQHSTGEPIVLLYPFAPFPVLGVFVLSLSSTLLTCSTVVLAGGYMVYATVSSKYVFDYREDDVYACVADVGWITGHTYIVYGPLSNGVTSLMFESTPLYPDAGRYWDMVERYKITQFYTAPTAIRALMKFGTDPVKKYDRSSLRVLGTVGEPINPEAWKWYYDNVGDGKVGIVDTYWQVCVPHSVLSRASTWVCRRICVCMVLMLAHSPIDQTETGGIIVTPLPGVTPMKPGAAMTPFFGVELALMVRCRGVVDNCRGRM